MAVSVEPEPRLYRNEQQLIYAGGRQLTQKAKGCCHLWPIPGQLGCPTSTRENRPRDHGSTRELEKEASNITAGAQTRRDEKKSTAGAAHHLQRAAAAAWIY